MVGVVLVTEAQQTERTIMLLIAVLLGVAVLLFGLTVWYWRHTSPKRYARQLFPEPQGRDLDLRQRYESQPTAGGYDPSREGHGRVLQADAYDPRRDNGYDAYPDPRRDPSYGDPYRDPRQEAYADPYRDGWGEVRPDPNAVPFEDRYGDPYGQAQRR